MTWWETLVAWLIACVVAAVWIVLIFDAARNVWIDYRIGRRARRRRGDIFDQTRKQR